MCNLVSSNFKQALYPQNPNTKKGLIIGILSFEVANVMSKIVNLHKSLSETAISKLKNEVLASEGIRTLVCNNEKHLLELFLEEKLDDLNKIACVVSRSGKKCTIIALQGFEHVYGDIVCGVVDVNEVRFLVKDMESMVRKMERYVSSTVSLYVEMEVLNELEIATKKFHHEESRKAFEQKLSWQMQDVRHLKEVSLWNRTYDKVVELLGRTVCTVYARVCTVFGDPNSRSQVGFSGNDGCLRKSVSSKKIIVAYNSTCCMGRGRVFLECLSSSASRVDDNDDGESSEISDNLDSDTNDHLNGCLADTFVNGSSTLGGSALALHYANVIIVLEKLLWYPHLVGDEARDDLYEMLPTSLRKALKSSLKAYVKDLAIYDAPLAHLWREKLKLMLKWLAPLAHNMMRWQSERSFEQHQIVRRKHVLLLQTLYFADREKTEAVISELLVGLNYICRYEQQQNALLDCTSSFDFEDCMQIGASFGQ